jgi:chromosome segregation ATPase
MPDVKDIRINIKATTDTQTLRQEFNTANETLKATGGAIQEVEKSLLRLKGVQQEDTIIPIAVDDKTQKKINSLFDKYKGLIKDLNSAEAEYQKTIEDLNKLRQAGKITQDEYNGAVQAATEIFEEAGGVYGKFRDLVLNVNEAEEQYRDTLRGLSELLEKGRITQDQYNDSVGKAAQLFDDAGGVYGEYRDLIVNVNVAEKQYQESIRGLSDLLKKGTITQDQYNEAVMRAARAYEDAGGPLGEYANLIAGIAESEKAYRTTIIDLNDLRVAGKITQDQYNEAVGKAGQIFEDAGGVYGEYAALITGVDAAEKEYLKTKRDLKELLDRGRLSQDQYNESVKRAKVAYEDATTGIESFGELAREGAKRAQGHLADFLFDPFDKGLDGMVAGFADAMQRVAAEAAAASIMESLTEGMEDFDLSNLFSWLGSGKSSKGSDSPAETVLALGGADEAAASITAAMTESGSTVANDIAGSFAQDGGSFLSSMSSIFSQEGGGFLSSLGSIFSGLFSGFGDAASGAGDWIASAFGSFFGGGRASGGPVMAGSFYEVGERNQPELLRVNNKQYLIPGNSGSVEPMAGGRRGGGNTYQTWNITTPNPDGFRMTERQQRRQARRFVS